VDPISAAGIDMVDESKEKKASKEKDSK
jgi:hypothetical protein